MWVVLDRDSVAMGDDVDSHRRELEFDAGIAIGRLLAQIRPDAFIGGGRATWLVIAGPPPTTGQPNHRIPIGVYAQEWDATRLFGPSDTPLRELAAGGEVLSIHFDYLAQVDPEIVFNRYRRGGSLSWEERSRLSAQRLAELAESDAQRAESASSARYLSHQATAALGLFGCGIRVHSDRYFSCELPGPSGSVSAVVQAHDSMAGVSVNGEHLANFRPALHAEQFVIVQLGDTWRAATGRGPVTLPDVPTVTPNRHGNRWSFGWTQGVVRHNATFGTQQELAESFGRYVLLPLADLVAAYLH